MGQVIFDEKEKPLMRMTYKGLCDDAEWQRHLEVMSEWARRGELYAVVIDAREVGRVPATRFSRGCGRLSPGLRRALSR